MAAHSITIDPDLQQRLERVAQREVRSPEYVVRDALEMYFNACGETENQTGPTTGEEARSTADADAAAKRESFLQHVDESYEHYRLTGLHVTWDEADQWLAKLESGENTSPPACHT